MAELYDTNTQFSDTERERVFFFEQRITRENIVNVRSYLWEIPVKSWAFIGVDLIFFTTLEDKLEFDKHYKKQKPTVC